MLRFDQDGWVDWNSQYPYGDIFSDNWKQAFDTDGDSYGDNHGPDCCDTWYDPNAPPGDQFPFDAKQYTDYDGMDMVIIRQILSEETLANLIMELHTLTAWVVKTQMVMVLQTRLTSGMNL